MHLEVISGNVDRAFQVAVQDTGIGISAEDQNLFSGVRQSFAPNRPAVLGSLPGPADPTPGPSPARRGEPGSPLRAGEGPGVGLTSEASAGKKYDGHPLFSKAWQR